MILVELELEPGEAPKTGVGGRGHNLEAEEPRSPPELR